MQTVLPQEILLSHRSGLTGCWKGSAENRQASIHLDLEVDGEGHVSGSGVRSVWSVDSEGRINGSGSFAFIESVSQIVSSAQWNLQLSLDQKALTGTFLVDRSELGTFRVSLMRV